MSDPIMTSTTAYFNVGAVASLAVMIFGKLPILFGLPAAIYFTIMAIESRTFQRYLDNRRIRRGSIVQGKLTAKLKIVQAGLDAIELKQKHEAAAEMRVEGAKQEAETIVKTVAALDKDKSKPTP